MRDWEQIRTDRDDLTDYVIHFTKYRFPPSFSPPKHVLIEILTSGFIRPSFAPMRSRHSTTESPTIKGADPAVCLTEQPLSAVLKMGTKRYSHYGIAYHKVHLYDAGARPVLYGTDRDLKLLPPELQYLWVRYHPLIIGDRSDYPVDFTWEREWRIKPEREGLPILSRYDRTIPPLGAIIVGKDEDVPEFTEGLKKLAGQSVAWAAASPRIISLETARRMLLAGDKRYARIETWPTETSQTNEETVTVVETPIL